MGGETDSEEVKNEVESAGGKAVIIQCNVADFDAVSYTHLESQVHENYKERIIKAKDIDSRVTGRTTGHPVRAPVSYTHLDVYKRQG